MSEKKSEENTEYRVLARKYRPQNFEELIGQEALVRTLTNAIESGRIAHAFMLTGVRGVGKTTTARIIAKALNYTGADGTAQATTGDTSDCSLCQAISEDRHPDVIEMDAATRTGIDDIREVLDGVRYAPTEARYKIYIIDEVHMLSKQAFNALLKTLEEPPAHVKFIFATTEIRKVPITVLSRCQRFDLRRVDVPTLSAHFTRICEAEGAKAEEAALHMISRAADGSVRDGLSILDQAIALGDADITVTQVQDMLGLADRSLSLDLLEHVLGGKVAEALGVLDQLYQGGGDPVVILQDLLDLTHILTRIRAVPELAKDKDIDMAPDMIDRAAALAAELSMPSLGKAWQILLAGLSEIQRAPHPQAAAEMVIMRLGYAANLPDPKDLIKRIQAGGDLPAVSGGGGASVSAAGGGAPVAAMGAAAPAVSEAPTSAPTASLGSAPVARAGGEQVSLAIVPDAEPEVSVSGVLETLEDVRAAVENFGEIVLASEIFNNLEFVKIVDNVLHVAVRDGGMTPRMKSLSRVLSDYAGSPWMVSFDAPKGTATLSEIAAQAKKELFANVLKMPIICDVMAAFPEAQLVEIKELDKDK